MSVSLFFLKCVGKGVINVATCGIAGIALDVGAEIAEYVWRNWREKSTDTERAAELQILAEASSEEMKEYVEQALEEIAAESGEAPSPEMREQVASYLYHVPSQIRRTMRRPSDPTGTTVPADLRLDEPEDLMAMLPERLPRFKEGDQPIPGVDLEIVELLGVGGFGEVWKARNPHLTSADPVALKFCLNEEASKTLKHEAAVLDRVVREGKHPGIVELRHTYLSADPPCLEYEYVDGGDLAGLIHEWHRSEKGLSARKAAKVVRLLAEILGFAHSQNPPIVHRDLKPANILVKKTPNGMAIKVADFGIGGIAAVVAVKDQRQQSARSQSLKQSIVGSYTPLYASPEQMRGNSPDPRDDVHALGVIWFQLMIGDLSAGAPSGGRWKKSMVDKGMPESMVDLMETCFETHAEDRPENAISLMKKIDELLKVPAAATAGGASAVAVEDGEELVELIPAPSRRRSQDAPTNRGGKSRTAQKSEKYFQPIPKSQSTPRPAKSQVPKSQPPKSQSALVPLTPVSARPPKTVPPPPPSAMPDRFRLVRLQGLLDELARNLKRVEQAQSGKSDSTVLAKCLGIGIAAGLVLAMGVAAMLTGLAETTQMEAAGFPVYFLLSLAAGFGGYRIAETLLPASPNKLGLKWGAAVASGVIGFLVLGSIWHTQVHSRYSYSAGTILLRYRDGLEILCSVAWVLAGSLIALDLFLRQRPGGAVKAATRVDQLQLQLQTDYPSEVNAWGGFIILGNRKLVQELARSVRTTVRQSSMG